jgi:S1-C subfamily serine protease
MLDVQDSARRPLRFGSGFFVRPDIVATNYHVIENASYGVARVVGETETYVIEGTVGIDKVHDLALLKLAGAARQSLPLADMNAMEVGEEIFVFGNPRRLEGTISPGIISGISLREMGSENLIQISAPISSGSSGGPVVNRDGEVIGVAVSSITSGQNLNFAVPSSLLAMLMTSNSGVSSLSSSASAGTNSTDAGSSAPHKTRGMSSRSVEPNHQEIKRLAN